MLSIFVVCRFSGSLSISIEPVLLCVLCVFLSAFPVCYFIRSLLCLSVIFVYKLCILYLQLLLLLLFLRLFFSLFVSVYVEYALQFCSINTDSIASNVAMPFAIV